MPLSTNEATGKTASTLHAALKGAFGTPPGFRPAHARGILLSGTFTPTETASKLSSAIHFNQPSTPVTARFSSSTGIPTIPDTDPNANPRGFAIRFNLPEKNGRRQHTDIVSHSTPFFPARTGEDFLGLLQAIGASSAPDAPTPKPIEVFLSQNPAAAAFVSAPKPSPASFATEKYWAVSAFHLISAAGAQTTIRYQIVPEAGVSHLSDEELQSKDAAYLHNEIQTRVIDGAVTFSLMAQLAQEGDQTDDATVHWPDSRELVKLGTVTLDAVVEGNDEAQRTVIFDPVPRTEGIQESKDPLFDLRADLYLKSGRERRTAPSFS